MSGIFITSTGTEIGKTIVAGLIIRQRRALGLPVMAIKPIISGVTSETMADSDTGHLIRAMGQEVTLDTVEAVSPFRYAAPLAPQMAAKAEGKTLYASDVIEACKETLSEHPFTLIEGVGGAHVPLDGTQLTADWITALDLPAIVVAGSYLGTMSHTLATMEALTARGIEVRGIVVNESAPLEGATDNPNLFDTMQAIAEHTDMPIIALQRLADTEDHHRTPDLLTAFGLLSHG